MHMCNLAGLWEIYFFKGSRAMILKRITVLKDKIALPYVALPYVPYALP